MYFWYYGTTIPDCMRLLRLFMAMCAYLLVLFPPPFADYFYSSISES